MVFSLSVSLSISPSLSFDGWRSCPWQRDSPFAAEVSGQCEMSRVDLAAASSEDRRALEQSGFLHNEIDRATSKYVLSFTPTGLQRLRPVWFLPGTHISQPERCSLGPSEPRVTLTPSASAWRFRKPLKTSAVLTCYYICIDFGSNDNGTGWCQACRVLLRRMRAAGTSCYFVFLNLN